ncbi:efflux RND transporter permease subunit [Nonomuraea sp. NBC_01738]|uniref:hypothetical protein n=1 Tax=Nonomuraea sp. NBC_01738 TaxID=2976003 RepID=UPI002E117B2C|nr:efflux RND transporter permease subunit [Nonomuraea sp. NBC_01738]
MSMWKKIGIALLTLFGTLLVCLILVLFVPGGWKIALPILAVPVIAGFIFWAWFDGYHPPSPRRDDPPRDPHRL